MPKDAKKKSKKKPRDGEGDGKYEYTPGKDERAEVSDRIRVERLDQQGQNAESPLDKFKRIWEGQ